MHGRQAAVAGLIGLAAIAIAIEAIVQAGLVSPLVLAPPSRLPQAFVLLWREDLVVAPFVATLVQALTATAMAIAAGVPLGVLLWRRPLLGQAFVAWLGAAFAAPLVLLYPLFLVVFGRGYATTVVVGFMAGVVPVILKTREGLLAVPAVLLQVGRSYNLGSRALFLKVAFPAAVPAIFTGIRLGLIYALVNIIGIEFLTDFGGLGRAVAQMFARFEIPAMYAAILLIVLASLLILTLLQRIEAWLRPQ
jgi:ABC-type nitrate/sulfonate/bicarbonate transport system permease component